MRTIPIASADDLRIADYVSVREADLVKRRGIFLAEGVEVVRTLVRQGRFPIRSLFLSERRLEAVQDLALSSEVPVYVAPQEVMDRVAGFPIHRGCLAAGERGPEESAAALLDRLPDARTVVVLEAIANHDNVGGIFRNGLALGADAVLLDGRSADPLYRKAIRVSMGATLRLPFARGERLVEVLHDRKFACVALTPHDAAPIDEMEWPERTALFLGTEGAGLDRSTIASCDLSVRIPMVPGVDSLNVATAAAIALFSKR